MPNGLNIIPERASTIAGDVDTLVIVLLGISVFFSLLVFALVAVFAIKYRRRSPNERPPEIKTSKLLEITWTVIPLTVAMGLFFWGAGVYYAQRHAPNNSMEIYVTGKQWMWKFQHLSGRREINDLHVPVGRPVKLIMASEDVIHSFSVPAFRVKQDVLPNRYTTTWFEATKPGRYHLFCNQYCGTDHSSMTGTIVAMLPDQFEAWLSGKEDTGMPSSPVEAGQLLSVKLGCNTCHMEDSEARAPKLQNLFMKTVNLADGKTATADESYLRESILDPGAKVVDGFQPIMPSFKALVTSEQLSQIIAYLKSLGVAPGTEGLGETGSATTATVPADLPTTKATSLAADSPTTGPKERS